MGERWVVLVEAVGDHATAPIGPLEVGRLLAAMDHSADGRALHCSERYAVQMTMIASSPAEALVDVLAWWADTVQRQNLPTRRVVRTEVLSSDEFEREFDDRRPAFPAV